MKMSKGIPVIKKVRHSLPQRFLVTIYKTFWRTLIDCGGIIYGQPQNGSFVKNQNLRQLVTQFYYAIKERKKLANEIKIDNLKKYIVKKKN